MQALGVVDSFDIAAFTPGVHLGGSHAGKNTQFSIRGGGTAVEAIGQVTTNNGAYYASIDGTAEAAKAIWAGTVGSKKTGFMSSTWQTSKKLIKPNTRAVVRLPTITHYGSEENTEGYSAVKALIPDYEFPASEATRA